MSRPRAVSILSTLPALPIAMLVAALLGVQPGTASERVASEGAVASLQPSNIHRKALDLAARRDLKGAIALLRSANAKAPLEKGAQAAEWDRLQLSLGRLLYESGDFAGAIDAYERVERRGTSWLEAVEEKAWALFRAGRTEEAIAQLKTVTSPVFVDQTRSEPFFLLALAQLRLCDFPALFRTLDHFKARYRDRARGWEGSQAVADRDRLRELGETVQKLNLVEAEAIQRLYLETDGRESVSVPKVKKDPGQLSFPATEGDEVWLDELESFKVSVRGCREPVDAVRTAGRDLKRRSPR